MRPTSAPIGTAFEALVVSVMPIVLMLLFLPPALRAPVGAPIGAAIAAAVVLRAFRLELVIDHAGVLIKSYWHTVRIHWSHLQAIELTTVSVALGRGSAPAVGFRSAGRVHAADATVGLKPAERRELADLLRELASAHDVPCRLRVIDRDWVPE